MMDIIQKLAGMVTGGGGGNYHAPGAISPAAGNPAIPLGMSPQSLGQYGGNYAAGAPMGGKGGINPQATPGVINNPDIPITTPSTSGPAADAGALSGGEGKWTDLLLRGLKGVQAGMRAPQMAQGGGQQAAPSMVPMQFMPQQGQILLPNKQLPYQKR